MFCIQSRCAGTGGGPLSMQLERLSEPGCAAMVQELLADSGQHRPLAVAGAKIPVRAVAPVLSWPSITARPCAAAARDAAVAEAGRRVGAVLRGTSWPLLTPSAALGSDVGARTQEVLVSNYDADVQTLEAELARVEQAFRGLTESEWRRPTLLQPLDETLPHWTLFELAGHFGPKPSPAPSRRPRRTRRAWWVPATTRLCGWASSSLAGWSRRSCTAWTLPTPWARIPSPRPRAWR